MPIVHTARKGDSLDLSHTSASSPAHVTSNPILWGPFRGGGTSKVKVVRRLLSLSSIHSQMYSNSCFHSSNIGELTLLETTLKTLRARCRWGEGQLRGTKRWECRVTDLGSNIWPFTIHMMWDQFPHLQKGVDDNSAPTSQG